MADHPAGVSDRVRSFDRIGTGAAAATGVTVNQSVIPTTIVNSDMRPRPVIAERYTNPALRDRHETSLRAVLARAILVDDSSMCHDATVLGRLLGHLLMLLAGVAALPTLLLLLLLATGATAGGQGHVSVGRLGASLFVAVGLFVGFETPALTSLTPTHTRIPPSH